VVAVTRDLTEITVVGEDDTGLIARITTLLFERDINIEDLDQAVRSDVFRMTMHVDASEMSCSRGTLERDLDDLAAELDVEVRLRFPDDKRTDRIAVLVTKESHCLEGILAARERGDLDAEIAAVVGNHDDLAPLVENGAYDLPEDPPFYDVGDDSGVVDEEWLLDILDEHGIDLIVLARFMRILSPDVVFRYEDRIINIHPSLLPAFPGAKAYRQAREEGVRIAGVTAHYVTTDLDQGPIICQRVFDVPDDADTDELRRRGQPLEVEALLEATRMHLNDDVTVHRGRVRLRDDATGYQTGLPGPHGDRLPTEPVDRAISEPDA
jgi:formyltetrahydrofolate deformylase